MDVYKPRQRFLIVCEGEKTEPNYFKKFRVPGLIIRVEGLGMNTIGLVRKTMELMQDDDYDQSWCVFDKDDFDKQDFNNAITIANNAGINVAYSNQCFELWYVLHFIYMDNAITRAQYSAILSKKLYHDYEKNCESTYDEIKRRQTVAIKNARRLYGKYNPNTPASNDPSTTVHFLVEKLLEYSRPFAE